MEVWKETRKYLKMYLKNFAVIFIKNNIKECYIHSNRFVPFFDHFNWKLVRKDIIVYNTNHVEGIMDKTRQDFYSEFNTI